MTSKGNKYAGQHENGSNADYTSVGTYDLPAQFPEIVRGTHPMKGIVGADRAKTYTPSGYSGGDRGGSAGGFGLPHGLGGAGGGGSMAGGPIQGMPSFGYTGAPLGFEGGIRGGAVSAPETLPAQYPYPQKEGYDETSPSRPGGRGMAGGTVHGVSGVEGLDDTPEDATEGADGMVGHSCPHHGCGRRMGTSHGLARHIMAAHGKFRGLGSALVKKHGMQAAPGGVVSSLGSHGTSYKVGQEFRGETEDAPEMRQVTNEYARAKSEIGSASNESHMSSYARGDQNGSYGRMSQLARK